MSDVLVSELSTPRIREMNAPRISENTLFSVLLAAIMAWTVASVADAAGPAVSSASCTVAKIATGIRNS